ncbi:hypothetical protein [Vibrio ostreicida]|uniref:hypothetical protein n=1 Tax=Vibrio ostreicida TaxID=526588 RepID=UPI0015C2CACA|nr:hypothetical protein [Vibrio ostreicida]
MDETKAWSKVESPVHTKESKQGRKQPGSKSNRSKGTHNYKKEEFIGDGGNPTHVHKYNSTSGHVKVNNKEYKYGTGNAKTDEQSMHDALNALNAYNGDVHKKEQILEFIVALINQYK